MASAGSKPAGHVHPLAIKAMAEIGIDISAHTSKHVEESVEKDVETVITACGNAGHACPMSRKHLADGCCLECKSRRHRKGDPQYAS